jgi:chemosensory pili system protein ChpC
MTQAASIIASQIVPLNDERLVLPNTAIAEIISFSQPDDVPSSLKKVPDWLLGMVAWRGLSVPVISFERMIGGKYETPGSRTRLVVLNAIAGVPGVPFIAIPTQTIPQLMQIDQAAISVVEDSGETNPAVACHVVVAGNAAIIPDLDEVERQVAEVFVGKAETKKNNKKKKNTRKK